MLLIVLTMNHSGNMKIVVMGKEDLSVVPALFQESLPNQRMNRL